MGPPPWPQGLGFRPPALGRRDRPPEQNRRASFGTVSYPKRKRPRVVEEDEMDPSPPCDHEPNSKKAKRRKSKLLKKRQKLPVRHRRRSKQDVLSYSLNTPVFGQTEGRSCLEEWLQIPDPADPE